MTTVRISIIALLASTLFVLGCGEDSQGTGGGAGTGGTAGTGGSAGSGGTAGTGGSAGSGGSAGTGGTAGSGGSAGTGGSNGGNVMPGLYRMQVSSPGSNDYWEVCFYVNNNGDGLTADSSCDVDQDDQDPYSFDFTTQVGTIPGGGSCNMNLNYDQDVSINSAGEFSFDYTVPFVDIEFSVNGTINGSNASGTVSGSNIPNVDNCDFNWTATHQ